MREPFALKNAIIFLVSGILLLVFSEFSSANFKDASPGHRFQFPQDHFSHDDYRIEWWYYTGHLLEGKRREFGYQLTFFRVGLDPIKNKARDSRWRLDQVHFAHLTLTDLQEKKFHFFERINRQGIGQAGAKKDAFYVWNEDWTLQGDSKAHSLKAREKGFGLDLMLTPEKAIVVHGNEGISRKGKEPTNASHYFSLTRMKTTGSIWIKNRKYQVRGDSWMDHEFSSNQLSPEHVGWDWFSIQLNDQTEIMLYQIRKADGTHDSFSSGTLIFPDGRTKHLNKNDFSVKIKNRWESPHSGAMYPAHWEIQVPQEKLQLSLKPDIKDQELHHLRSISASYWEGSVGVEGKKAGEKISGKGYVELVGYEKALVEPENENSLEDHRQSSETKQR